MKLGTENKSEVLSEVESMDDDRFIWSLKDCATNDEMLKIGLILKSAFLMKQVR